MTRFLSSVAPIALMALLGFSQLLTPRIAAADAPPTQAEIDFAMETADLLQAEVIAALLQEFSETTPQNVEHGKLAISLIFDDGNKALRLIGEIDPLSRRNKPRDGFEETSLELALTGISNEAVQKIQGDYYFRRSIPLSNFSPACVLCHTAFGPTNASQWVGALTLRVPTRNRD